MNKVNKNTTSLCRLFWDAVQIDWPTDHHDFRRTGFTLLKGDVNKATDIDASNIALKDSVTSDIVIRPSVSDLDNNEHQDVVTVIHPLGDSGSDVFAVERSKRWYAPWWLETKQKWHAVIPASYPVPQPTLTNLNSKTLTGEAL